MNTINAYELISLLSAGNHKKFRVRGTDLNRLHSALLKKNIRGDFSRSAFEEMALCYPHNVEIIEEYVCITVESQFEQSRMFQVVKKNKCLTKIIEEEWKVIKEY